MLILIQHCTSLAEPRYPQRWRMLQQQNKASGGLTASDQGQTVFTHTFKGVF